jgi:hypothetical protein
MILYRKPLSKKGKQMEQKGKAFEFCVSIVIKYQS